jgi:hypothetical protein
MLPSYYHHVRVEPHTLLTRFLGLYKLRSTGGATFHLLVMSNVMTTALPVHERFDLKGSTQGRSIGEANWGTSGVVHKDLDFRAMGRAVRVGSGTARHTIEGAGSEGAAARLRGQVHRDVQLLRAFGCIDYSFLVGVHYAPTKAPDAEEAWKLEHEERLRALFSQFQQLTVAAGAGAAAGTKGPTAAERELAEALGEPVAPPSQSEAAAPAPAPLFNALEFERFAHYAFVHSQPADIATRLAGAASGDDHPPGVAWWQASKGGIEGFIVGVSADEARWSRGRANAVRGPSVASHESMSPLEEQPSTPQQAKSAAVATTPQAGVEVLPIVPLPSMVPTTPGMTPMHPAKPGGRLSQLQSMQPAAASAPPPLSAPASLSSAVSPSFGGVPLASDGGSRVGVRGEAVYYLGIIDHLVPWDSWQKRSEHVFKTVLSGGQQNFSVSAVHACSRTSR